MFFHLIKVLDLKKTIFSVLLTVLAVCICEAYNNIILLRLRYRLKVVLFCKRCLPNTIKNTLEDKMTPC